MTGDRVPLAQRLPAALALAGLLGSVLAWWASLYPTLIPRDWLVQAVVSGASAAIGYGIGSLVGWGLRQFGLAPDSAPRWAWPALAALWIVALVAGAIAWPAWQNDLRDVMGVPHVGVLDAVLMAAASLAIGALLVLRDAGWGAAWARCIGSSAASCPGGRRRRRRSC